MAALSKAIRREVTVVEWYWLLAALTCGVQIGAMLVEDEWRKEREAEFDRRMAALRAQATDNAQKGGEG